MNIFFTFILDLFLTRILFNSRKWCKYDFPTSQLLNINAMFGFEKFDRKYK